MKWITLTLIDGKPLDVNTEQLKAVWIERGRTVISWDGTRGFPVKETIQEVRRLIFDAGPPPLNFDDPGI